MNLNIHARPLPIPQEFADAAYCCVYDDPQFIGPHGHVYGWERLRTAFAACIQRGALGGRIVTKAEIDYLRPMLHGQTLLCEVQQPEIPEVSVAFRGKSKASGDFEPIGHVKFLFRPREHDEQAHSLDCFVRAFEVLDCFGGFVAFAKILTHWQRKTNNPEIAEYYEGLLNPSADLLRIYEEFQQAGGFRSHAGRVRNRIKLPTFATRHATIRYQSPINRHRELIPTGYSTTIRLSPDTGLARVETTVSLGHTISLGHEAERYRSGKQGEGQSVAWAKLLFVEFGS